MIDSLNHYLTGYPALLSWLALFSLAIFLLGIVATPFLIAAIPDNYFDQERPFLKDSHLPFLLTVTLKIIKNLLGVTLIVGGLAMLLLPGQGILTLIVGLLLLDYPGKYHIEKKLISRPRILKLINWIRKKNGKKEFEL